MHLIHDNYVVWNGARGRDETPSQSGGPVGNERGACMYGEWSDD